MLDESRRTAILELHERGHGVRAIARALQVSRAAVRDVVRRGTAEVPRLVRPERAGAHEADIRELYLSCRGNLVRVHEELTARGAVVSYPALTAFCRRHGIGFEPPKPAGQYHFAPGEEMQHDTSPHRARIGGVERAVQTASLVLCYSRMLFIQLYPAFNRFTCKVFLTDALVDFGGAAERCMIDNTHVVVLRGTGKEMVAVPEMVAFGERYGFTFVAHEVGHANRSARVERPFDFIENNFLAGREFRDFAHLNQEARAWCERVNGTRKKHLHASPRELFLTEQPKLTPLPIWVPEVYALHQRLVDLEGYVHAGGNTYSVPYQLVGRRVEVRETKDQVRIFDGPRQVAVHARVLTSEKRRVTVPEHRPPRGAFSAHVRPCPPEEKELAGAEPVLAAYAAELKKRGTSRWTVALRRLWQMWRDYPRRPLLAAIRAATHYGLYDIDRLERMVLRKIAGEYFRRRDDEEPGHEG
ncbi:MAG: IS21 family transposase [Deltaproteobacteria bacterium]|nr:IS21 family transposase [Deltaproteobacteria bacterium]